MATAQAHFKVLVVLDTGPWGLPEFFQRGSKVAGLCSSSLAGGKIFGWHVVIDISAGKLVDGCSVDLLVLYSQHVSVQIGCFTEE